MPNLPVLKPRQVVRALEKAGFVQVRQRGSHLRLKRGNLAVTVPMHAGDLTTKRTTLHTSPSSNEP